MKAAVLTVLTLATLVVITPIAVADDWFTDVTCGQANTAACDLSIGVNSGNPGTISSPDTDPSSDAPMPERQQHCRPTMPPGLIDPGDQAAWRDFVCAGTNIASGSFESPALWIDAAIIAAIARQRLGLPRPVISASPRGVQMVNLPTWLWLSGGWSTVSATASLPGASVTATATPSAVSWSMGDGTTLSCTGPGTPYRAGADPRAASPDCGHVYRRSSAGQPGQVFTVTATVHWRVTWSGAGEAGAFPDLTTTNTARFRVTEAQALNNDGG